MATTKPRTIKAPSKCPCGSQMPWHLFAVAGKIYTHNCRCGQRWRWVNKTTAVTE